MKASELFWTACIYFAIGGLFLTGPLIRLDRECGTRTSVATVVAVYATWPAWLGGVAYVALSGTELKSCKGPVEKDKA